MAAAHRERGSLMAKDAESTGESPRTAACIRLDDEHRNRPWAVCLLEALGVRRHSPAGASVYRFLTSVARDRALDTLRGRLGWTAASPCEVPVTTSRPTPPIEGSSVR